MKEGDFLINLPIFEERFNFIERSRLPVERAGAKRCKQLRELFAGGVKPPGGKENDRVWPPCQGSRKSLSSIETVTMSSN
jgi:hypothetical protein